VIQRDREISLYGAGEQRKAPTFVDLFCGAGGLTLGFCQAGGKPLAAIDKDHQSVTTYREMFPICKEVHTGDITEWQPTFSQSVDVVVGGPPCQGFSLARGFRFVDDARNHLYKEFVRLVATIQPAWVVMENVPGITNIGNGVILRQILEDFDKIGYWMDCKVINMAEFGVPQTRRRAIFVGSRSSSSFSWPEPSHVAQADLQPSLLNDLQPFVSVGQALGDLPWPLGEFFSHRANSQMRGPRNRSVKTDPAFTLRVRGDEFALCERPAKGAFPPGPVPPNKLTYRTPTHSFQQLMRESPPKWIPEYEPPVTVSTPPPPLKGTRRLTVREQARLQTFPDWFRFSGSQYLQGKQIGNAVPPLFARKLFAAIVGRLQQPELAKHKVTRGSKRVFDVLDR